MAYYADFRLTIEGEEVVAQRMIKLSKKLNNFSDPLSDIGKYLNQVFYENWKSEGRLLEDEWDPLSPNSKKYKSKKYPGKQILERTGKLSRGFDYQSNKTQITLYNSVEYFEYHQSNKPRTSNLPRRVMLKVTDRERKDIALIFTKYLNKSRL